MTLTTTIITVKRPSGEIERVTRDGTIDPKNQALAIAATKAAGKGDILSPKPVAVRHCCSHWTRDQGCPLHGDEE